MFLSPFLYLSTDKLNVYKCPNFDDTSPCVYCHKNTQ